VELNDYDPDGYDTYVAERDNRRATEDAQADDYYRDRATQEAERDRDAARTEEAEHIDKIRRCIMAGNDSTLCQLDPDDPYGINRRE
jgi:hypothetical protein